MLRQVSQTAHRHVLSRRLVRRSSSSFSNGCNSSATASSMMTMSDNSNNNNNNDDNQQEFKFTKNKLVLSVGGRQNKISSMQIRNFGLYRRSHQQFDKDPELTEDDEDGQDASKLKTSDDMDFYDPLKDDFPFDDNDGEDDDESKEREEEEKRQAVRDEIDSRTGRLWTDPWEITDEDWMSTTTLEDLPDWTTDIVSRISKERVNVHPDGIPTLKEIVKTADILPPSYPQHPASGNPKPYLKYRKQLQYQAVYNAVSELAQPHVESIMDMDSWEQKQNAVDELFETIDQEMKEERDDMSVLKNQPFFQDYVEKSLQAYLRSVVKDEQIRIENEPSLTTTDEGSKEDVNDDGVDSDDAEVAETEPISMEEVKQGPEPYFMDLLAVPSAEVDDKGVPKILHPLKTHPKDGIGRMVEEWELAAHDDTKRIMVRECIAKAAAIIDEAAEENHKGTVCQRVYLSGTAGVGKTAALAALVASARTSGHVVLYIPDGDRLRKLGKYTEPNKFYEHDGKQMFDLPVLAQEICGQLLESHETDLSTMDGVSKSSLEKYMSASNVKKLCARLEDADEGDDIVSLTSLLKLASESTKYSSTCYLAIIDNLMNQTTKPFTIAMDEFNCYFDHGQYFHEAYDPTVRKSIPYHHITLFQPLLNAMGVQKNDPIDSKKKTQPTFTMIENPTLMKRGSIIAAGTGSRAVVRQYTSDLEAALTSSKNDDKADVAVSVLEVPIYSPLEVEHILANFEIIGFGKLRFDRGETVMNDQEVAYLRTVSGGVGQHLLDACVM